MNKFKVNNIFNSDGKTLDEIISNFVVTFLDDDFKFYNFNDIMSSDTILNN